MGGGEARARGEGSQEAPSVRARRSRRAGVMKVSGCAALTGTTGSRPSRSASALSLAFTSTVHRAARAATRRRWQTDGHPRGNPGGLSAQDLGGQPSCGSPRLWGSRRPSSSPPLRPGDPGAEQDRDDLPLRPVEDTIPAHRGVELAIDLSLVVRPSTAFSMASTPEESRRSLSRRGSCGSLGDRCLGVGAAKAR
jgi:hypothetical protein